MKQNILTDKINHLFWKLSVPAVLGMIAASSYQFVDSLFVGIWVGIEALSVVSLSDMIVLVFNGVGSLIGTGASSILSRAIGENYRLTQRSIYPMAVFLPVLLITSNTMKINGIWVAFPITDAIILLVGIIMFYMFRYKYLLDG